MARSVPLVEPLQIKWIKRPGKTHHSLFSCSGMKSALVENIFLGQVLSICLTVSGTVSQLLRKNYNLDLSALQMMSVYGFVALIFWIVLIYSSVEYFLKRKFLPKIPMILLISCFDTTASVLLLHSYNYLSLPTITLLSTLSTPTVMILSWLLLGFKYWWNNILGACMAIGGVILLAAYQDDNSSIVVEGLATSKGLRKNNEYLAYLILSILLSWL